MSAQIRNRRPHFESPRLPHHRGNLIHRRSKTHFPEAKRHVKAQVRVDHRERAVNQPGDSNGARRVSFEDAGESAGRGCGGINGHRDRGLRRGFEGCWMSALSYAWRDECLALAFRPRFRHPTPPSSGSIPRNRLITTYTSLRWDASQGLSLIWVIPGPRSS
jgi:hypothetical protein